MVIRTSTTAKQGRLVALIVAVCFMMSGGKHPAAQSGYTLVPILGPLGAPALDVNDNGVVVGSGFGSGTGFIWTQAGGVQPMPIVSGGGVNDITTRLQIN